MSVECEYCHVTVQRATYLPIHQSTTRKCILIQKTLGIDRATKLYECEYCHKQQTTKDNNIKHSATCKIKLQKEKESVQKKLNDSTTKVKTLTNTIEDRLEKLASDFRNYKEETSKKEEQSSLKQTSLEKEIMELKKQINELNRGCGNVRNTNSNSNNKTTNSHNTTNHITIQTVMTPEKVEDFFKKNYKLDTLLEGQKGLARFVNEGFLKSTEDSLYQCTDRSRQKFVMKHEDGTIKEDTNCEHLVNLTKPGLDHVSDIYETSLFDHLPEDVKESDIHDNYRMISELGVDRGQFKGELSRIIAFEKKIHSNDMSIWDRMKSKITKEESLPKPSTMEESIPVPRPDIGGISRGKLSVYRDRYRKDGTIKYPKLFQDKLKEGDTSFQADYLEFLKI